MKKAIAERLKTLRHTMQWSQSVLAEKLQIKLGKYQAWELGRSNPPILDLLSICRLYGITPNDLFADQLEGCTDAVEKRQRIMAQINVLLIQL